MATTSHSSNAYTDQEKKFLIAPIIVLLTAVSVFLYVYYTIPSKPYTLQEAQTHEAPVGGAAAEHK